MWILLALCLSGPARAEFRFGDLASLIQSQGLNSVEATLARLPEEFRANYTLMAHSRSLQPSSPLAPRAILFGSDGRLICTFNGGTEVFGGDSFECIQFRNAERSFEFRQIVFPTPENGLKAVAFPPDGKTLSGISCSVCHGGADPRPNWDDYNFWPGAYGQEEDKLGEQANDFRKFVEVRYDHPRYRWLIQDRDNWAPFRLDQFDVGMEHRPNLRFAEIIGRLNAARAARILGERLPAWERWAYVVASLRCELSADNVAELKKLGHDPATDLQLAKIFADVGLASFEWSARIEQDKQKYADKPWEQQTGFNFFSENVAMAVIQEEANRGNAVFAGALTMIRSYYETAYSGFEKTFYQTLNEIVPATDLFGQGYADNLALVCPESAKRLVSESGGR